MSTSSQWLFPLSALRATPTGYSPEKEFYDRARGVEFLFRLGSSLALFVVSFDVMNVFYLLQSQFSHFHRSNLVPQILHEIFNGRFPPPGKPFRSRRCLRPLKKYHFRTLQHHASFLPLRLRNAAESSEM